MALRRVLFVVCCLSFGMLVFGVVVLSVGRCWPLLVVVVLCSCLLCVCVAAC